MNYRISATTADGLYRQLLSYLLAEPLSGVAPRAQPLRAELIGLQLELRHPQSSIITSPQRRLNYSFMVAEAVWMILGSDAVDMISHYCDEIAQFSDDGKHFYGAYGPRIGEQLSYLLLALHADRQTRQAVITTWRPSPPATKDVPCTLSLQVLIRNEELHLLVNMRSSDAWLGIPYDIFNFALIQNALAGQLGCGLGTLLLTLGSAHLYQRNTVAALDLVRDYQYGPPVAVPRLSGWIPGSFLDWEKEARVDGVVAAQAHGEWMQLLEPLVKRKNRDLVMTGFMKELL